MTAQVFLEGVTAEGEKALAGCDGQLRQALSGPLASLSRRGGGYRSFQLARLPSGTLRVDMVIDVRDALGANRLNTAAESVSPLLERISGGRRLMAILTNAAAQRLAGARFSIPVDRLAHGLPAGMSGPEAARRIAAASVIAQEDPSRAVTHNKGIMNGIASLALGDNERCAGGGSGGPSLGGQGRPLSRPEHLQHGRPDPERRNRAARLPWPAWADRWSSTPRAARPFGSLETRTPGAFRASRLPLAWPRTLLRFLRW